MDKILTSPGEVEKNAVKWGIHNVSELSNGNYTVIFNGGVQNEVSQETRDFIFMKYAK